MSGELIPRVTVYEIEANRNAALALYGEAFDKLEEARQKQGNAMAGKAEAPALAFGNYSQARSYHDRAEFLARARQEVDRGVWAYLIDATKLESLMDHTAREQFRQQLRDNPPEATADNCLATLQQFAGDSAMIFRRGIATAFSKLDRRFRSHDGFKIGARIVLSYAFEAYGSMSTRAQETLRDVERTFYVLDKKEVPEWGVGICGLVSAETRGLDRRAFEVESDYFRVKAYKNGNAHVWIKRDDLLERVNLLLAEHYGEALGAGADAADKTADVRSTAVARNMGWFPTPEAVASRVLESARIQRGEPLSILEPSAGEGAIARLAAGHGHNVSCIELHPGRAQTLRALGFRTVQADFLETSPALGLFDRVVMNPPFDKGLDIDHVRHAFKFLRPGGILCAVMSAGTAYREDARTEGFREWAERHRAKDWGELFDDLPPGSFKDCGTMVNATLLTLRAPSA